MNYIGLLNINYDLMNPFIRHNIFLGLKMLRPTLRNYIITKCVIKRERKKEEQSKMNMHKGTANGTVACSLQTLAALAQRGNVSRIQVKP